MKTTGSGGLFIALFCGGWQLIMGFSGWYRDPVLSNLFWLMIPILIAGLIWGLRRTAKEGKGYWAQVGQGTLMSLIAGVVLFFVTCLFTAVLFPDYFAVIQSLQENALRQAGKSPQEIKLTMETLAITATPLVHGISALTGMLTTGFVASLLIAAFVHDRQ
jgi:hypothetical protein